MGLRERLTDWFYGEVDLGDGIKVPREVLDALRAPEPYTKGAEEEPSSEYIMGDGPATRVTYPSEMGSLVIRNLHYPYDVVSTHEIERFQARDEEDFAAVRAAFEN